jgi:hypothetical protein
MINIVMAVVVNGKDNTLNLKNKNALTIKLKHFFIIMLDKNF